MGKTYKAQSSIDYLDDLFDDYPGLEESYEDDVDLFLDKQVSRSSLKRNGDRSRKKSLSFEDSSQYRLPRDWQDFDYTPDSLLSDEWR